MGKFDIILFSTILGNFTHILKYSINEKYLFEVQVNALITPVTLELSKLEIKFQFPDESQGMEISEQLKMINKGNAPAKFKWISDSKVFSVFPSEGEVFAGK